MKCGIKLLKISTTEIVVCLFTKGLFKPGFEHLNKKSMGW